MSELAVRDDRALASYGSTAPAPYPPTGPSGLIEWGHALAAAGQIADAIGDTEFVPKQWRGRKPEVAAAIMTGAALGMDPLAALRAMDSISGQPAFRANTMRGLVQSAGHEIWIEEANSTRAIVKGRRRGGQRVETSTWTIDRARQLGLVGKDNWKKQPQVMLVARGTSEIARLIAADVLLGMPYSSEEIDDTGETIGAEPAATIVAPARRTAQRKSAAPVAPALPVTEPDFEPEPEPEPPATDVPDSLVLADEPRTEAQSRAMFAMLGSHGVKDREDVRQVIGLIIDRPIESTKELTKAEVSRLLDELPARLTAGDSTAETAFDEARA